jgi:(p)ppGpp synthase/HD superfamily hydrolase
MENDIRLTLGGKQLPLIEAAARIAMAAHSTQTRKDDGSPYIIHPQMVALKLGRHGFDDTTIAAALTHDVLEDTNVSRDELEELLGTDVVSYVLQLTEDTSLPWKERKQRYIESIRRASPNVKAISACDKIHNLESLLLGQAAYGERVWSFFNKGRDEKTWFEHAMLDALRETWQHPLIDEYAVLVARLDALN